MNRISVTCELRTYDDTSNKLRVHSHWNENGKIVLEVDGKKFTVVAKDLEAALKNCTNAA